ncbi:MAG: helix-hairpin-helix domain-containing protein [Bdellovibrionia bacterium]
MNFETWLQTIHPEIPLPSVTAVLSLSAEGATVPFIARYRKERTGSLDEVAIQNIIEGKERWDTLIKRQAFIIGEIESQKKLTAELKAQILSTFKPEVLEDLYLPYKIKRKTRAATAKEAGLEPLAQWIWDCGHGLQTPHPGQTLEIWAFTFRNEAKDIPDAAAAIAGAQDILIERISEIQHLRQLVREQFFSKGTIQTKKGKKAKPNSKFENYFEYREGIASLLLPQNSHRYLAMKRGWTEEELILSIEGPMDDAEFEKNLLRAFENEATTLAESPGREILLRAAHLAFKAHVLTSIENEIHKALREVADASAIDVFAENLRRLLLAAPYGAKSVLGVDPGVKTGCKIAVVDDSGKYIASTVIFLNSEAEREKAGVLLCEIVKTGGLSCIAVGNGTAGRESETFIRKVLVQNDIKIPVIMVSESGASVYSASEAAREEFPDLDLTVRGAISIARRLQDPLAELVKVDPKSIGVGQYQHDVSPHSLKRSLASVVESCVNQVGVNLNTASYHLLSYVSGIGPSLAKSLVEFRNQKGLFQSREDLLKVDRFSKKAFEQAAGFLRIPNSSNPLDNTGVHPENYEKLNALAQQLGKSVKDFTGSGVSLIKSNPAFKAQVGEFTYEDIIKELEKPGRDPREQFTPFQFLENVFEVKDLKPGMLCPGIVTNVTNFGAFVDIGVHQDGLVHISQLSDHFVKDPKEVVSPGDQVKVRVLEVNVEKNQISLSMKNTQERPKAPPVAVAGKKGSFSSPQPRGDRKFPHSPSQASGGSADSIKRRAPGGPSPIHAQKKPKEVFNNAFAGLAALKSSLKPK